MNEKLFTGMWLASTQTMNFKLFAMKEILHAFLLSADFLKTNFFEKFFQ